jgi:predicted AlkP superfamily phosphohydrolase/phosphomutase
VEQGLLPNIQLLLKKGAWGITENPLGLYVGAVWPSFYTGVSPAEHSRYCFKQLRPGTYDTPRFCPSDVTAPPFWEALSHAHKKVAIIDVPKTFPSPKHNGIHIVDWGAHDPEKFETWPAYLSEEVQKHFGQDIIGDCNALRTNATDFIQLGKALKSRAAQKTDLVTYFLEQGEWDCFLTVYSESHCVGHQCWHLHDPEHPRHNPDMAKMTGDLIKDVYIRLDEEIGKLLERSGPNTVVMFLASHGMGPHYDATFLLDTILQRLEIGVPMSISKRVRVANRVKQPWKKFPYPIRHLALPLTKWIKGRLKPKTSPINQRKWFQVPNNDVYGGIRINLKGREPQGIVETGPHLEKTYQELSEGLLHFTNLETGEPLVKRVLRTSDIYKGRYVDHLPDLLVEWNRVTPISRIHSTKTGPIEGEYTKCRTGDHTSQGMFILAGPGIKAGQVEQSVTVMDLAPTIGDILDVDLGKVEGKSILPLVD